MKILGTGLNGLVGSRISELLGDKYQFENISRSTGVDIQNKDQVTEKISSSDADVLLHLVAKTDVDGCEKDKEFTESGEAWQMNVIGTQYIVDACKLSGKKIIYISTDFVFDGTKGDPYSEDDTPHPLNWYAHTKWQGELIVQQAGIPYVIMRLAYPYGRPFEKKKDFVQAILSRLQNNQQIMGVTDHFFTPTYLDDIAFALDAIIAAHAEGIYHVVGNQSLTPYTAALRIAEAFGYDTSIVQKTTREIFFRDRAQRPYNLSLKNDKITKLGVNMRGFQEGLEALK